MEKIFLFGAGGHAKALISVIEEEGRYEPSFLIDDDPRLNSQSVLGYPVVGAREELAQAARSREIKKGIVAIGDNRHRLLVAQWLCEKGFQLVKAVHPTAYLARRVAIGDGSALMAGVVINPDTSVGTCAIINTSASVDHDCTLADGVHVAPGCRICGGVTVGRGAFIGAGAIVTPGRTIGRNAVVGAGSVVLADVADGVRAAGNPCRPLSV
ncbi:MAG: acetyltransferase [Deltaproteobacteria bacterium]|nr:acetyltransferase [Deltaproteobacteria bacterium]